MKLSEQSAHFSLALDKGSVRRGSLSKSDVQKLLNNFINTISRQLICLVYIEKYQ